MSIFLSAVVYPTNHVLALSFLIPTLEALKKENWVDCHKLDTLIKHFYTAHQLATYQDQLFSTSNPLPYERGKKEIRHQAISYLEENKRLFFPTGYLKQNPIKDGAGHGLLIEFSLDGGKVSGAVLNSGNGLSYHGIQAGTKLKYRPLTLAPIPLAVFKNSDFLERLIDFQTGHTNFTPNSDEFYEKVFSQWPGERSDTGNRAHVAQHGPSCSIKPWLWLLRETLGPYQGKCAKIYLECTAFDVLCNLADFTKINLERVEDAHEVIRIEIPRFQWHFTFGDGKWESSLHPGYFIDAPCMLAGTTPALEPHRHYVILRNEVGKKMIVMPNLVVPDLLPKALEKVNPAFTPTQEKSSLFTFTLNRHNEIEFPSHTEHAVYLFYLALRSTNYPLAAHLFQQLKKEKPLLDKECCSWIHQLVSSSFDAHPEAMALRLHLRMFMKEHSTEEPDLEIWKKDYLAYLDLRTHVQHMPLTSSEELTHIALLQKSQLSPRELYRLSLRSFVLGHGPYPHATLAVTAEKKIPPPLV